MQREETKKKKHSGAKSEKSPKMELKNPGQNWSVSRLARQQAVDVAAGRLRRQIIKIVTTFTTYRAQWVRQVCQHNWYKRKLV